MDILNYKKPGAAAAMDYFWPGLGHFYLRDFVTGLKWSLLPIAAFIAFITLWILFGFAVAVVGFYLIDIAFLPAAYRSAYDAAVIFNEVNQTSDDDILEDPSTACMMTILHPGLGQLYIGAVDDALAILRISKALIFLPLFILGLHQVILAIFIGILCGIVYFISSYIFGRKAYFTALRLNEERAADLDRENVTINE